MSMFRELLSSFSQLFRWWVVVAPWEQALRIRAGKRSKLLLAGVHFRIPFWDRIYRQSVRLRAASVPTQTLSTKDGFVVEIRLCLIYQIVDMEQLYESIESLDLLAAMAATAVAEHVTCRNLDQVTPVEIESVAGAAIPMKEYGLSSNGGSAAKVLDIVFLKRTYRLITGDISSEGYWDSINLRHHEEHKDY